MKLAKIDADEYGSVKGTYGVQGFPTLIFFNNGQSMKYNGQRSKEFMVNWLSKKTRDPVLPITPEQLEDLTTNGKVNIVFHGDLASESGQIIANLAKVDDFNSYYQVSGSDQPEGTVQIIRNFGETVSTAVTEAVGSWIKLYERPVVYPFNDRTIGEIFSERGTAVILFHNAQAGEALVSAFNDAAKVWRVDRQKSYIFTDIPVNID